MGLSQPQKHNPFNLAIIGQLAAVYYEHEPAPRGMQKRGTTGRTTQCP
jgi:hypothetical protein